MKFFDIHSRKQSPYIFCLFENYTTFINHVLTRLILISFSSQNIKDEIIKQFKIIKDYFSVKVIIN